MAKKAEEKTMVEKRIMKVRALVNIKYDKDCFKIGDEFEVSEEDSKEITEKGYVELLEELQTEKPAENENNGQGEPPKEGE